jgi:antitoxin CptB
MLQENRPSQKKLIWQCRRGMLELDVILHPFLLTHFSSLNLNEQHAFESLLNESDPDLYTWLMGFGCCQQSQLKPIIEKIRIKMNISS